jgi:hypothetical protein
MHLRIPCKLNPLVGSSPHPFALLASDQSSASALGSTNVLEEKSSSSPAFFLRGSSKFQAQAHTHTRADTRPSRLRSPTGHALRRRPRDLTRPKRTAVGKARTIRHCRQPGSPFCQGGYWIFMQLWSGLRSSSWRPPRQAGRCLSRP